MKKSILFFAMAALFAGCRSQDSDVIAPPPPPPAREAVQPQPLNPPEQPPPAPPLPPPPPPVIKFPSVNAPAAVAFEDMSPSRNDEDFNDFLTDFKIFEKINDKNQLTNLVIDFYPRAVGAWFDHRFLIVLNGIKDSPTDIVKRELKPLINGSADVTLKYFPATGNTPFKTITNIPSDHDVVIFESTHALFTSNKREIVNTYTNRPYLPPNQRARLEIAIKDPSLNPIDPQNPIDLSKFRMMLHVKDTNRDVDIIDVDQQDFDVNKRDGNYYPFGFIIPDDWHWPKEGVPIYEAYPSFAAYRNYLHDRATNPNLTADESVLKWYLAPPVRSKVYDPDNKLPPPILLPDPW